MSQSMVPSFLIAGPLPPAVFPRRGSSFTSTSPRRRLPPMPVRQRYWSLGRPSTSRSRVAHAVGVYRPPAGRHAQDDRVAPVMLVVLEEVHQPPALGQGVLAAVVEADAPDGHDRLAVVPEVSVVLAVPAQAHVVHQPL